MLINSDGSVNPALVRLVQLQGLGRGADILPRELNDLLQITWVKAKAGTFRAQLGGRFPTAEEKFLLNKLGAGEVPINFGVCYEGTLVLGATLKAVTRRLWFLNGEERRIGGSIKIPQPVYLLGSYRPLKPNLEMPEHVPAIITETGAIFNNQWRKDAGTPGCWPHTEIQMMVQATEWLSINRWQLLPVTGPDDLTGAQPRHANTAETVKEWLCDRHPKPGRYLVASSQPFCEGQLLAVQRAVKEADAEGYTFGVCGPEAPELPLSNWLDNLAKQLWEECQSLLTTA